MKENNHKNKYNIYKRETDLKMIVKIERGIKYLSYQVLENEKCYYKPPNSLVAIHL